MTRFFSLENKVWCKEKDRERKRGGGGDGRGIRFHRHTYRYEVSTEDNSKVGDVDSSDSWLIEDIQTDNPVLLQLNCLTGIEGRRGKVRGSRGREVWLHL